MERLALGAAMTARWAYASLSGMQDLVFESTRTVTQPEFAAWVAQRGRAGDVAHYELLHGRIVMSPPAGYPHGKVESLLNFRLTGFVLERALGEVFGSSQGFELPTGDTVEPDLAFVSAARWAAAPPPEVGKLLRVVPDLIVEILSPANASYDRGEKKAIDELAGVREYWMVDSRAREVRSCGREAGESRRFGAERVFAVGERAPSAVLAGLAIEVAELFP